MDIQEAVQKAIIEDAKAKGIEVKLEETPVVTETTPATTTETTPGQQTVTDSNKESSLHTEAENKEKGTETEPKVTDTPPITQKSLEDLLSERSQGKFKTYEDIEKVLNEPKIEFTNEEVKKLNEFAKDYADPKVALELFVAHNNSNYKEMDELDLCIQEFLVKNPEMEEDDVRLLLHEKYKVDEWSEEGDEETKTEKLMKIQMKLDSKAALSYLEEQQKKALVENKKPDPKIAEEQRKAELQAWEKVIAPEVDAFTKLVLKVNDKENVDLPIDPEIKASIKKIAIAAGDDLGEAMAPFFKGEDGKFSQKKFIDFLVKATMHDKSIEKVSSTSFALGQKALVAEKKNINMEIESVSGQPGENQDVANAKHLSQQMKEKGLI